MTKIVLKNEKEYPITIGGTSSTKNELKLKIITDEALENIMKVFKNKSNTSSIKCVNEASSSVLAVYEGYVEPATAWEVEENYMISAPEYSEQGEETKAAEYGRVVKITLYQKTLASEVAQQRADIDYLAIMTGTEL